MKRSPTGYPIVDAAQRYVVVKARLEAWRNAAAEAAEALIAAQRHLAAAEQEEAEARAALEASLAPRQALKAVG